MFAIFGKIWAGIKGLGSLMVPLVAASWRTLTGWPPWLRWTVRIVLLAAILVGLYLLNDWLDLEPRLRTPYPWLRQVWLPLLFVLAYLLFILGSWLWRLLGPDRMPSAHPDIEAAWAAGLHSLEKAGLDITHVPLFLVLGRPRTAGEGGEDDLFFSAKLPGLTRHTPPGSPLHVYANSDAVFVTCHGTSLLGTYLDRLMPPVEETVEPTSDVTPDVPAPAEDAPVEPMVALLLGGPAVQKTSASSEMVQPLAPSVKPDALLKIADEIATEHRRNSPAAQALHDPFRRQLDAERLAHVCRHIVQARKPFCPINGLLLTVPFLATTDDPTAAQVGAVAQIDLDVVRDELQVQCPALVLLTGLDRLPGCEELVAGFSPDQRHLPLGQPFPLLPVLDPSELADRIEESIAWLGFTLLPLVTTTLYRFGTPSATVELASNARLFQLHYALRERLPRLARLVTTAMVPPGGIGSGPMYGGSYVGATGHAPEVRAFVTGVMRRLIDNQNAVRWTPEAIAEERAFKRWTLMGYGLLGLVLTISAGLLWHLLHRD